MNPYTPTPDTFNSQNASDSIHNEGFRARSNPPPYAHVPNSQLSNTSLSQDANLGRLPSPHIPPFPSTQPYNHSPYQGDHSQPLTPLPRAPATSAHQSDFHSLPEDDDLPPLPSILNETARPITRTRDGDIELVAAATSSAKFMSKQKKGSNTSTQPTQPQNGARAQRRGGRGESSRGPGFSTQEDRAINRFADEINPIGMDGWVRLHQKYAGWARENGYSERTVQSLKKRFDRLVENNMSKPTGSGTRGEVIGDSLRINGDIEAKSGIDEIGLQTEESDNEASENEVNHGDASVSKKEDGGGDTVKLKKGYKSKRKEWDREMQTRSRNGTAVATEALNETVRLQNEIQHLRDRIETLRDDHFREVTQLNNTIIQERERANRAETELRLTQMQLQMGMGMGMMGMGMGMGYHRFDGAGTARGRDELRGNLFADVRRRRSRSRSPLERYGFEVKRTRTRSPSPSPARGEMSTGCK